MIILYRISDLNKSAYRVNEVAKMLGVTTKTIRNYDKEGKLKTIRSEGNHRMILREDMIVLLQKKGLLVEESDYQKRDVIYARVSSHEQKKSGDLDRQVLFLIESIPNLQNPLILKEVGSGLNDKRIQLQKLITMVCEREIKTIYVTYKDRLTRFGFHYLETMCLAHGTEIIVVKDKESEKTVQEELVEDMMSLIASFSGKLYGMRSGKNKRQKGRGKYNEKNKGFRNIDGANRK